ncbi:MAG: hypothetical protein KAQ98_12215 [Bacteriovoracaceae bacterium]|nr:hypothetical protein [Bacteriovoracaceae bacterium]
MKLEQIKNQTAFFSLTKKEQEFIKNISSELGLTFQETRQLVDIALDVDMWDEGTIEKLWPSDPNVRLSSRARKEYFLSEIQKKYVELKSSLKDYSSFNPGEVVQGNVNFVPAPAGSKILGLCPVAGEKTRCCNLLTMDVVLGCAFDCSYCTIQSYYHDNAIMVERNLKEKLFALKLDPNEIYHIGTGQSSDSLLWGNRDGILEKLFEFATENANVILELKTKSDNVEEFLNLSPPRNVIATWTLNTPTVIKNEERLTSSLNERINAARKVADNGTLVGFHFHPMVWYRGWEEEYEKVAGLVMENFDPKEVAMVSFGTLTYIKPVIRKLRKRRIKSKSLQMPFEDAHGKLSYPKDIKISLFKKAYQNFSSWHGRVFFYLCMEAIDIWNPVFGFEFQDNDEFERMMKLKYMEKIKGLSS